MAIGSGVLKAAVVVLASLFATWAVWIFFYAHPEFDGPFGLLDAATMSYVGVAGLIVVVGASLTAASLAATRLIGQMAWLIIPALACCALWIVLIIDPGGSQAF